MKFDCPWPIRSVRVAGALSAILVAVNVPAFGDAVTNQSATKPPGPAPAPVKPPEKKERKGTKWDLMDVGPFFTSGMAGRHPTLKALSIKLGRPDEAAICFDTELMRVSFGWTGGFLRLPTGRDGLEGIPEPAGTILFLTPRVPGWAKNGKFEDPRSPAPQDPKGRPSGPLPRDWAHWRGLFLHGNRVILSYSVGSAGVLELPGFDRSSGQPIFTRTLRVDAAMEPLALMVAEIAGATGTVQHGIAVLGKENKSDPAAAECVAAALLGNVAGNFAATNGRIVLHVPAPSRTATFQVALWAGSNADLPKFRAALKADVALPDLAALTKGGPARWGEPLPTRGVLGHEDGPYVVDTLTLPEDTPFKSWIRCGGFDFFADASRAAVCSVSGDVWIVSGIDEKLEHLKWRRFATGLFQPLGLRIVNDKVYVTGRDQITRLHDLNGDGEADFYENFNNEVTITPHYHEFCLGLETDSKGNFYFTKGGNLGPAKIPHHGTLLRVSPDGRKLEVVATGFRAPNGLSLGPNDEITTADNEGEWVPTSRVNLCRPGGFYGHVFTAHTPAPPTNHDAPILWLPHSYELDNSSGGQVWVAGDRWGPFRGDMLHTSYGACTLFKVMLDRVDGQWQAAAVKFPLKFNTGIMRGRFNPRDGQLYLCGLNVWQSRGPKQGGFQRVRYTGRPVHMPKEFHVKKYGVEISFTDPLDPATAGDSQNFTVEQWNYAWTAKYGSPEFSVADPERKGRDKVEVKAVRLSADRRTVWLAIPGLRPVMQMRIKFKLTAADGSPVSHEIHATINRVPAG